MNSEPMDIQCDLLVIGSGMAGSAAALFATQHEIDTVQVGMASELNFASGLLDYMAVHPLENGHTWSDPVRAIQALVKDQPEHPYAKIDQTDQARAWEQFLSFLKQSGLPYTATPRRNVRVVTPAGTLKTTYAVPTSMTNGVTALENGSPCLIVDFKGLKGFSGRQIVETLKPRWPTLRARQLTLPGMTGELYTEPLAQSLHLPETIERLGDTLQPHIGDAQFLGLPAILGISKPQAVFEALQERLGIPVFEIPTMPPAVMGLRLRTVFERHLPRLGVRLFSQHKVLQADLGTKGGFRCQIGSDTVQAIVRSRGIVLATGRFFGGGLLADHRRVSETLFDLPVRQPRERQQWHRKAFLDPRGHAINRAGLETDACFRPLAADGQRAHNCLFAAGSILAHQDWMRMKCGSGLAITSAYGAISKFAEDCGRHDLSHKEATGGNLKSK